MKLDFITLLYNNYQSKYDNHGYETITFLTRSISYDFILFFNSILLVLVKLFIYLFILLQYQFII